MSLAGRRELAWLDPVQEAILARLGILARHVAQSRRCAPGRGGLRRWQFKVLLVLRGAGPPYEASPVQLADMLGLTRGALMARLGPLEADGLITRARDAVDQRRVHVRLTPAGYKAFEQHASFGETAESTLLAAPSRGEQQTLADLLRKLVIVVESGPGA
jgi:DNA-binding MarR family transcriptional regulator